MPPYFQKKSFAFFQNTCTVIFILETTAYTVLLPLLWPQAQRGYPLARGGGQAIRHSTCWFNCTRGGEGGAIGMKMNRVNEQIEVCAFAVKLKPATSWKKSKNGYEWCFCGGKLQRLKIRITFLQLLIQQSELQMLLRRKCYFVKSIIINK